MSRRETMSPDARQREREANRIRMALKYSRMTPSERTEEYERRKAREKKKADDYPEWEIERQLRRSASLRRYFKSRQNDHEFMAKRIEYLRRWRRERFIDEAFEDFLTRIEGNT